MTPQQKALQDCVEALEAHHQHHMEYDEHNGYLGSDLADVNGKAITQAKQALEVQAQREDEPEAFDNCRAEKICRRWCGNSACISHPQASEPAEDAKTWCEYVAGMIGGYLNEPVDSDKCKAIAGIIERRLWALPAAPEATK